jgi:iron complex outermembrane receptor protein
MTAFARWCLAVVLFPPALFATTIRGVVKDVSGHPLAGAAISVDAIVTTTTAPDGSFVIDAGDGAHIVGASRASYQAESRETSGAERIDFALRPALAESIVVSGIHADAATPVTKTDMPRQEIEREYHQQDIPLLLHTVPSINVYTESGIGGSGYSYLTLRGVASTRLNFTLDGVPLADSEDMGTFFADFPDLAHSLQAIQVQRGVGTSTVGSPSFGGSINLQSIDLSQKSDVDARLATGSYGTRFATVGYQSGFTPGGFALYTRFSTNETNGFREHSGVQQRNIFFSAAKQNDTSQLRFTGFSGHERQQMSFNASDAATLRLDARDNPLAPEDRDSFGYDLGQLQYIRAVSPTVNMTASAYYQRGYGWYRLFDDDATKENLRQYGLDGMLVGSLVTMSWMRGPLTANYGLNVNEFRREHTRDLVGGARDYANYGTKGEENAFAKFNLDLGRWHLYSDAQIRHADFHYHGDVAIAPIQWTFFNPKVGARRELASGSSVYASVGASTREPARNDLFEGEDNATIPHDLHAVRPERLYDFETGWERRTARWSLGVDAYAMEFRNEIAATGELSPIGLPLRRNVDRSYRRGLEIDGSWQAAPSVVFRTTANLSRNRIRSWTQFYDVFDDGGSFVTSTSLVHRNVSPLLTPAVIVNQSFQYTHSTRFSAGVDARYVSRSFLDNTNNTSFVTPAMLTADANVSFGLARWFAAGSPRISVQVNNVLNRRNVYPSGYSSLFLTQAKSGAETIGGTSFFYPQAPRHFVVMLDVKM